MGSFLLHLLIEIAKIAVGVSLFGLALAPHFKKTGIEATKAYIPFYNILTWLKLTKNGRWLFVLMFWAFPLPISWMIGISFGALAIAVFDTYKLYKPEFPGYWLFVVLAIVVAGAGNHLIAENVESVVPLYVLNALLTLIFFALLFTGASKGEFDHEAYEAEEFSFQKYAMRQFGRNRLAMGSVGVLAVLVTLAVYAPYVANDQPLYAQYEGETYFPAWVSVFNPNYVDSVFHEDGSYKERIQFDITNWKQKELDKVVWAAIPFAPNKSDRYNRDYVSPSERHRFKTPAGEIIAAPFLFRHHLGTDQVGKDVLSGLIHGTRISLVIGLISMGIATIIGILLGALAGYYGDGNLRVPRIRWWMFIAAVALTLFYFFIAGKTTAGIVVFIGSMGFLILAARNNWRILPGWLGEETAVPMDSLVNRGIEILNSLPRLLIIITITAIFERSMVLLMVIIGVTSWTGIARFTRAELLRTRELEFIDAARSLGFNEFRVIFRHALPNSLAPVFVAIAFGIASAILIESGLSFLGIGVPDDVTTWGQLLKKGREEFEAWWLVIFPGAAIFITVTAYNLIGEALRDALDPKLKQ